MNEVETCAHCVDANPIGVHLSHNFATVFLPSTSFLRMQFYKPGASCGLEKDWLTLKTTGAQQPYEKCPEKWPLPKWPKIWQSNSSRTNKREVWTKNDIVGEANSWAVPIKIHPESLSYCNPSINLFFWLRDARKHHFRVFFYKK